MKILDLYDRFLQSKFVSTDTRNINKGALFFALKGANFNANAFAQQAIEKGASCVIIDEEEYYVNDEKYILVDDVLQSLQDLASYHRKMLGIPILALTGSNGKTTTKELINVVLSKKYIIIATIGNLNNHIGVPLTLLSLTKETEMGVIEMGANHFGEIAQLCEIVKPDYGYITNFGKAHLEGFGSLEGVIKAKTELYKYLKKTKGTVFVNKDDLKQIQHSSSQKRELIGESITNLFSEDFVKVSVDNTIIQSNLLGDYNYLNISTAIGIGLYFKVSLKQIKQAIESFIPDNKRSQLIKKENLTIILDAYNANPTSMKAAINSFINNKEKNKIVILGDMFELGSTSPKEHQEIAELAVNNSFLKTYLIGESFFKTEVKKATKFKTFKDFKEDFRKSAFKDTIILIKASRGMALERIDDLFD
jgi:UDP-N-acetylmuramoyl-tripeptide--D-alanyl-D-alanine ligase